MFQNALNCSSESESLIILFTPTFFMLRKKVSAKKKWIMWIICMIELSHFSVLATIFSSSCTMRYFIHFLAQYYFFNLYNIIYFLNPWLSKCVTSLNILHVNHSFLLHFLVFETCTWTTYSTEIMFLVIYRLASQNGTPPWFSITLKIIEIKYLNKISILFSNYVWRSVPVKIIWTSRIYWNYTPNISNHSIWGRIVQIQVQT